VANFLGSKETIRSTGIDWSWKPQNANWWHWDGDEYFLLHGKNMFQTKK